MTEGTASPPAGGGDDGTGGRPSTWVALGTFAGLLVSAGATALIYTLTDPSLSLELQSFVILAPIYTAAQAIERLIEPLAIWVKPTDEAKQELREAKKGEARAVAAAPGALAAAESRRRMSATRKRLQRKFGATEEQAGQTPESIWEKLESAAKREQSAADALAKKRSERALLFFLIASVPSLLLAGILGLGIIQSMSTEPLEEYLATIDVVLTGLVIGAGTKPLHDLISRIEKSKDKAEAEAEDEQGRTQS